MRNSCLPEKYMFDTLFTALRVYRPLEKYMFDTLFTALRVYRPLEKYMFDSLFTALQAPGKIYV